MLKSLSEREFIVKKKERKPYGAEVLFEVNKEMNILGPCTLLIKNDIIVELKPSKKGTDEESRNRWKLEVKGFSTAGKAEEFGLRIVFSLLWWAISRSAPVRLLYDTPLPCQVFDRTAKAGGLQTHVSLSVVMPSDEADRISSHINEAMSAMEDVDKKMIVSMELFNAALHETTERATFVMMMSSIEPLINKPDLTESEDFGDSLQKNIDIMKDTIKNEEDVPGHIRDSIIGQISKLKEGSIGQGLRNLCETHLPDDQDAYPLLRECYRIRSRIVHDGGTDDYLQERTRELQNVLRRLFASVIGLPLEN